MFLEHLTVEVRNREYERVGLIEHSHLDIHFTKRLCDVGEWEVSIPASHPMSVALATPGAGIIISYRGEVLMSGPMTKAEVESREDGTSIRNIEGVCDNIVLEDRLVNVAASANALDQTPADLSGGFYSPNDIPARAMAFCVWANASGGAHPSRRNTHLSLWRRPSTGGVWPGSNDPSAIKIRYDSVLGVCRALVERGGAFFEVRQGVGAFYRGTDPVPDPGIVFRHPEVIDTDGRVRFDNSLVGGLESSGATVAAPTITRALIGGTGHLNYRVLKQSIAPGTVEADWGRIIERFGDERSSAAEQELTEAGMEMLADGSKTQVAQNIELTDDTRYEYGVDYTLGSEIIIIDNGEEISDICREVSVIVNSDGMRCGIKIGEMDPDENNILARVSNLERLEVTGAGPWRNLDLTGGWEAFPFQQPQYRVNNGEVILRGGIRGGSTGTGAVILPEDIAPTRNEQYLVPSAWSAGRVTVSTSRRVNVDSYLSGGDNSFVSMNGIRYFLS